MKNNNNINSKYKKLLDAYLIRRKKYPLDGSDDIDESYKWNIVSDCSGRTGLELVNHVVNAPKPSIKEWCEIDSLNKCLKNHPEPLTSIIDNLLDESRSIEERLSSFIKESKKLQQERKSSFASERTAATLLTCHDPQNYCFFTPEAYGCLHNYLDDDNSSVRSKYVYFLKRVKEISSLLTDEIRNVQNELPIRSDLLVAQDACWEMFMNTPNRLKTLVGKRISGESLFQIPMQGRHSMQGNYFIWIGTHNQVIGNSECHYEFCWDGNENAKHNKHTVFVEVHFEKKDSQLKDEYKSILRGNQNIKKFKWPSGIDGIRINDQGFDFIDYPNVEDLVNDTFAELKKLDEIVYPAIKRLKEMEKLNNNIQDHITRLSKAKNLIFTGAPGTGKTYLARHIAATMIGCPPDELDKRGHFGFVQFHPSYDYTDFVEGLRPVQNDDADGQIGFERKDGVFKEFCEKALSTRKAENFDEAYDIFLDTLSTMEAPLQLNTPTGSVFAVSVNNRGNLNLHTGKDFKKNGVLTKEDLKNSASYNKSPYKWWKGYYQGVMKELVEHYGLCIKDDTSIFKDEDKPFVFVIDEINRGEISKIFGELFFSVDPGYRGKGGALRTQYANLQSSPNAFDAVLNSNSFGHFFVPENVYIIGTMNDIDRSVESMDFAMRRRFAWQEVTAEDSMVMLNANNKQLEGIDDHIITELRNRMRNLNEAIVGKYPSDGNAAKAMRLGTAYQIGGSYFLKFGEYYKDKDNLSEAFEQLWDYHIKNVVSEYLRGNTNFDEQMAYLKSAYDDGSDHKNEEVESTQNA